MKAFDSWKKLIRKRPTFSFDIFEAFLQSSNSHRETNMHIG